MFGVADRRQSFAGDIDDAIDEYHIDSVPKVEWTGTEPIRSDTSLRGAPRPCQRRSGEMSVATVVLPELDTPMMTRTATGLDAGADAATIGGFMARLTHPPKPARAPCRMRMSTAG
jgi:hypothetical protein